MSETDAYFAGLIDGEGCIGFEKKWGSASGVFPIVQINMTDYGVLRDIQAEYGGQLREKKVPASNKPQWLWRVRYFAAVGLCERLLPYLRVKREAAIAVLEHSAKMRPRRVRPS